MNNRGYDVIGDIHGHADELVKLLTHLGYQKSDTGYKHDTRKVLFLGDFIDGGEHLRQHRQLLDIVMPMVNNGHAYAVMGNHEFNALAFHTMHNGEYLRPRTDKNIDQHQAFLNEFEHEPALKKEVLDFFRTLPMWLEKDGLRAVHACWDESHREVLEKISSEGLVTDQLLIEASIEGSDAYKAVERLLKGVEIALPRGITFKDKKGYERSAVRIQWWNRNARTFGEMAMPLGVDIGTAANEPVEGDVPRYAADQVPCFVGHYWLNGEPKPLADNVACLDYSIAKDGKLVAYRFSGESVLTKENFVYAS